MAAQKNPGVADSGASKKPASHRSISDSHDMGSDKESATLAERAAEAKRHRGADPDFWLHISGSGMDSEYQFFPDGDAGVHREARYRQAEAERRGSRRRAAAPGGGGLVNPTNKCGSSGKAQVNASVRRDRFRARDVLSAFSTLPRVRACGRIGIRPAGTVDVRLANGNASLSGLGVCGSVWACPICSAKIQSERREELAVVQEWAESNQYTVLFGTMTLRHTAGQSLAELWGGTADRLTPRKRMSPLERIGRDAIYQAHVDRGCDGHGCTVCAAGPSPETTRPKPTGLSKCFAAVRQSRRVRRLREKFGFVGYVRVIEVTYGAHGWHPHIHVMYVLKRPMTDTDVAALADAEFGAWRAAAKSAGLGEPLRERFDLQRAAGNLENYFTKSLYYAREIGAQKVGYELAGSMTKKGKRKSSRTPFEVLADFVEGKDAADLAIWTEYERTSYGRRAMTWSRGLKDLCGLNDVSDEDIAGADEAEASETLFVIADWCRDIARRGNSGELTSGLLMSVEGGGKVGGLAYCAHHGIETYEPTHEIAIWDRMAVADQRAQQSVEREPSDVVAARAAMRQEHVANDAVIDLAAALDRFTLVSRRRPEQRHDAARIIAHIFDAGDVVFVGRERLRTPESIIKFLFDDLPDAELASKMSDALNAAGIHGYAPAVISDATRRVKDELGALRRANARLERMKPEEVAMKRARATCEGLTDAATAVIVAAAGAEVHECLNITTERAHRGSDPVPFGVHAANSPVGQVPLDAWDRAISPTTVVFDPGSAPTASETARMRRRAARAADLAATFAGA